MSERDLVERLRGFQKHVMEMDDTQWGVYRSSGGPRICLEAADEIETMRHEIAHRIRRFCWHAWELWSEPFTGTWIMDENHKTEGYMTQKRRCQKCGRVSYRKCR
jgi:hypothetical protein